MSRIYFNSEHETTHISGSERAHMNIMVFDIGLIPLLPLIKSLTIDPPNILKSISNKCYMHNMYIDRPDAFEHVFKTWFHAASGINDGLIIDNQKYDLFGIALNTSIVMGSSQIKLFALINGLCELHGYIEGHNRKWVASIIKQGLNSSMYRKGMGWDKLIIMLELNDHLPVVMSYSVCGGFPNMHVAGYENEDEWYSLSEHDQWKHSMAELRKNSKWLEIKPNHLDNYYFDTGINSFDVYEYATRKD